MVKIHTGSPTGDTWPRRPMQGDPLRLKFASALTEILAEQKKSVTDLAVGVFGIDPKTKRPASQDTARQYLTGDKFPSPDTAATMVKFLGVTHERLLNPKGPLVTTTPREPAKRVSTTGAPAPLPLPADAPPLDFKLETYKGDPRFATVTLSGVAETDVALAMFGLINRK